jgi:hypothetical protein
VSTNWPSQIEVFESPDGVHFRLPPPAGSWSGVRHEVCVTGDGKLYWQTDSAPTPAANAQAVADLARFVVSPFGHLAVLAAETRQGTLHALCTGYPHAWLAALATELSRRCRVPAVGAPAPGTDPPAQPPAAASQPLPPLAAAVHQLGEGLRARSEQLRTASVLSQKFVSGFRGSG